MGASHTPGPWRIERSNDGEDLSLGAWDLVVGDGRTRMVLASRSPWFSRAHESEANARLIAAAPELLAALRELLALGQQESIEDGDLEAAQAAAKAAIRKAVTP